MLTIKVWGLPEMPEGQLVQLAAGFDGVLRQSQKKLQLNENEKIYLFPADLMQTGLGDEILIEVSGLPREHSSARITNLLEKFAIDLIVEVTKLFPHAYIVSRLERYDPNLVEWTNQSRD